jgi:hypothetical protein
MTQGFYIFCEPASTALCTYVHVTTDVTVSCSRAGALYALIAGSIANIIRTLFLLFVNQQNQKNLLDSSSGPKRIDSW